jgi:hypothetical protein
MVIKPAINSAELDDLTEQLATLQCSLEESQQDQSKFEENIQSHLDNKF